MSRLITALTMALAIAGLIGVSDGALVGRTLSSDEAQAARRLTPAELAAVCKERANLQTELDALNQQFEVQRQVIRNMGFDRTVADFETYAQRAQETQVRRGTPWSEVARKFMQDQLLDAAINSVKSFSEAVMLYPSGQSSVQFEILLGIIQELPRVGPQLVREIQTLAKDAGPEWRLFAYSKIVQGLGELNSFYSLATAEGPQQVLWEGTLLAASKVAGIYGLLLQEVRWAATNLYDAASGRWMAADIERLTRMTQRELVDLKARTNQMTTLVDLMRAKKDKLQGPNALAPCDSTQLASQPTPPTQPQSRGGIGVGTRILAGAAAVAAGIALGNELSKATDTEPTSTASGGGGSSNTGGGGGGGGPTGVCVSQRVCIINQVAGGCSCNTAADRCGWTGPVAQLGDTCNPASNPCAQGLSCDNGRCRNRSACGG